MRCMTMSARPGGVVLIAKSFLCVETAQEGCRLARFPLTGRPSSCKQGLQIIPVQTTDHLTPDLNPIPRGGSRPLFPDEVRARVAAGARLVRFEFCFSLLLFTLRRQ